jgi:hypothetical protein
MQSRDFCFWLQGFFELSGEDAVLSADQAAMIRRHLDMVFHHEIAPEPTGVQARERAAPPAPTRPVPVSPPTPAPDPGRQPDRTPEPPYQPPMC